MCLKNLFIIFSLSLFVASLCGCGGSGDSDNESNGTPGATPQTVTIQGSTSTTSVTSSTTTTTNITPTSTTTPTTIPITPTTTLVTTPTTIPTNSTTTTLPTPTKTTTTTTLTTPTTTSTSTTTTPTTTTTTTIISPSLSTAPSEKIDLASIFAGQTSAIKMYGWENAIMMSESGFSFARILYPANSYDPGSMIALNKPVGGVGIRYRFKMASMDCAHLVYYVRFAANFPFVQGGKLPGLAGGSGNTGGNIPNGYDGFSARLMWRTNGAGEIYAYLPNSQSYGSSFGRGSWYFGRGVWQKIEEKLQLNTPGQANGYIAIWINDNLIYVEQNLNFRSTTTLKIDQVLFETFFGGNTPDWAPSYATYADFSSAVVTKGQ